MDLGQCAAGDAHLTRMRAILNDLRHDSLEHKADRGGEHPRIQIAPRVIIGQRHAQRRQVRHRVTAKLAIAIEPEIAVRLLKFRHRSAPARLMTA